MPLFNNPISIEKATQLISLLDLPPNSRALDIGCGRGEFLIRVLEAYGGHGLGIDIDADSIAAANENAGRRLSAPFYEFREGDAQSEPVTPESFDLAVCLGSTHAYGLGDTAYPNALNSLLRVLRPGGLLLVGEGYWKQPPDPEYLKLIGEPLGIYHDHATNISFAEARGWIPLYAAVSSDDEWDHFEWSHRMRIEQQAARHPDASSQSKLENSRKWRDGYLRWGRATMGFGFYLLMKPARSGTRS